MVFSRWAEGLRDARLGSASRSRRLQLSDGQRHLVSRRSGSGMWFRAEGRATSLSVGVRGLGFCLGRGEEEEKGPSALDDQAGEGSIENAMGIWVPLAD